MTDDLAARLDRLEAANAALAHRNDQLAVRNDALASEVHELRASLRSEARPPALAARTSEATASRFASDGRPLGRRQAVKAGLGLAGAAAAGAVLLHDRPAAAADGDPVLLGRFNVATSATFVQRGIVAFPKAFLGGESTSIGLADNHLKLIAGERYIPTADTVEHFPGDIVMDRFGTLWLCVQNGTPGTWRTLAGVGANGPSAGAFYPFTTPVRAYDSRPGTTPTQGPKTPLPAGNQARTIGLRVTGFPSFDNIATTAVVNVLLVNATTGNGNFAIWANGQPKPQSNTLVWGGNAGRFTTLAVTRIDPQGRIQVDASLATDIVLDVVGIYA